MARIGSIACPAPGCGNPDATVSATPTGTLNLSCHRCQFSAYGKAGTKAHRLITAAMRPDDDPAPLATPKAKPAAPAFTPGQPPVATTGNPVPAAPVRRASTLLG
jgi:hypothetical protein